jgi:DNA-binding transcriptional ArsR family regulator
MARLLEGEVLPTVDPEIERLRAENRRLQREVADAKIEAQRAREDAQRALSTLRRQLSPLYRALQAVFGELDAAGIEETPAAASPSGAAPSGPSATGRDPRVVAVYESWKQRLGPAAAKVIDALLVHGEMNTTQLSIAAQMHRTNVPKAISKLNQAGLVNKIGGRFSLKPL